MKTLSTLIVTGLLAGAFSFAALAAETADQADGVNTPPLEKTTGKEVRKEVKEAIDAIKSYSAGKRDEALAKAKAALDDFDARMEKLEDSMKKNKEEAIAKLKEKRAQVAKRYDEMKRSTKENWEKTKARFIKDYRELEQEYEEKVDPFLAQNETPGERSAAEGQ